jgi:hypothetical protein
MENNNDNNSKSWQTHLAAALGGAAVAGLAGYFTGRRNARSEEEDGEINMPEDADGMEVLLSNKAELGRRVRSNAAKPKNKSGRASKSKSAKAG